MQRRGNIFRSSLNFLIVMPSVRVECLLSVIGGGGRGVSLRLISSQELHQFFLYSQSRVISFEMIYCSFSVIFPRDW